MKYLEARFKRESTATNIKLHLLLLLGLGMHGKY